MPASTMKLVLSFIGVLALVAFSGFILFDATKAEVVITNDGEEQTVKTHKSTVKEVLAEVGIRVGVVEEQLDGFLQMGGDIPKLTLRNNDPSTSQAYKQGHHLLE